MEDNKKIKATAAKAKNEKTNKKDKAKKSKNNKAKNSEKSKAYASIKYLTKEGMRNLYARKAMSLTSIFVLFSCLVLIGTAIMAVVNIDNFIGKVQDQNVIMVFAENDITDENLQKMKEDIEGVSNVKETIYISKEAAYDELQINMEDSAILFESLDENPLPDAYEVHLVDQSLFSKTVIELSSIENVQNIRENRQIAAQLLTIKNVMTYISIAVIAFLLIISLIIIDNTIRLTIENRRLEISIMKSVGATNWFVRWPFMVEGMLMGLISGLLALLATSGIYLSARHSISRFISKLNIGGLVPYGKWALVLLIVFVAFGVIAGAVGSAVSTARYLKEKESVKNE